MSNDWTSNEVKHIVRDYFSMLKRELNHQDYNKTEHRKRLLLLLTERSKGSIEFKHANISAVLINMGLPYIKGYQPRFNYQKKVLEKEVAGYIIDNKITLEKEFEEFVSDLPLPLNKELDLSAMLTEAPSPSSKAEDREPTFRPIKINYLEKEQNNRSLGEAGEELIFKYEKWRLVDAGKNALAEKVEWISKDKGDGAGFDILSRNIDGSDRYIEVKTTKLSRETPIFLTKTELSFASIKENNFYLYRLFNFDTFPQFFLKQGKYEGFCELEPQTYKGLFKP